ncbi:MAG: NAD(P)-dependent glycerol-3-phosphate dehydrogenase [Spirochaetia bacterium]|jgi:glycerol-3-phosphate dehydrogenase (NAD(P)+)|nr:NAD(P)-dependent glycerol-3-phosphate dehydrogenase [Spirochaetia bacterium]
MTDSVTGKKVGVISAGAWGTAVAKLIAENGNSVKVWDFMESVIENINKDHINERFLPGVKLPDTLTGSSDITEAAINKDFLILAAPSLYIMDIAKRLIQVPGISDGKTVIGVLTKGFIETPTGPSLILKSLEDYLPGFYRNSLVYISGPSHAEEVARGKLTGLISASKSGKNAIKIRKLLSSNNMLVFPSLDTEGVQTAGAVKNVIAIAFGMLDALMELSDNFGDNSESLLLAAGLNEIQTLGAALGSEYPETFTSIAGVGDLDVTCRSKYGRNRRFGGEIIKDRRIVKFESLDQLIDNINEIGYLPEGIVAARFVQKLAALHKLKLPICNMVYRILNREIDPSKGLGEMLRGMNL